MEFAFDFVRFVFWKGLAPRQRHCCKFNHSIPQRHAVGSFWTPHMKARGSSLLVVFLFRIMQGSKPLMQLSKQNVVLRVQYK